ncbi:hypothetical protein ABNF97_23420 [Plantactinospora sp. B6F1]|uniref:hypothetical protein n=1 Tax=Plantactinospora sp. B6F1 TaxID=3158971 RepID=UPI0032D8F701
MSRLGRLGPPGCRRLLAGLLAVPLLAGCDSPEPDRTVRPEWQPLSLPAPAGATGRLVVRDVATCAGRWYAVGAFATPAEGVRDGDTRPAAWTSADGLSWTPLRLTPRTYYGQRALLYSVACRDGRVAVIGAKRGGAHANPRVGTWHLASDGSLVEVTAPFELYGGPQAVDVARVSAGPGGFLIAGNRMSGAAVWRSADAGRFDIVEAAPGLASDARGETWAFDGVATPSGWLLVGGIVRAGRTDRDPLAWTSSDGLGWRRLEPPATAEYEELQRVVLLDGTPVAVGLRGAGFGAWRGAGATTPTAPTTGPVGPGDPTAPTAGPGGPGASSSAGDGGSAGWVAVGRFGAADRNGIPRIRSLTVAGGRLLVATSDGIKHALWSSDDGGVTWRAVSSPVAMPAGVYQDVVLRGDERRLVLVVDDGEQSRLWWSEPVVTIG